MVDALTKIEAIKTDPAENKERSAKTETLRKMMMAMARDVRVILVKLCDRTHNLRTISALSAEKRRRIAKETQEIYAPIASRLGMDAMWSELMELSFQAAHPWRHRIISTELVKAQENRRDFVESAVDRIKKAMLLSGIHCEVFGRRKKAHSVYLKMREKKLRLAQVHDRDAVRIVVDDKPKCYMAIGVLHELWKPIPGFFKDYIAIPKLNGYQSLHTAMVNEQGTPMEAQVRTKEMHARAEDGLASHWVYKSKEEAKTAKDGWMWLQSLVDIQASAAHADDYLEHVKTDLFSDEVYVFTPRGEVVALPRGASVLDFAFGVHSELGMRARGARVNGEPGDLSRKLRSGDIVDIEGGAEIVVQAMWLGFAKSASAKSHIRAHLRGRAVADVADMGAELLANSLGQLGMGEDVAEKAEAWAKASKRFGSERQEILARIGRGSLSALGVAQVLAKGSKAAKAAGGLLPINVAGEESETMKMARCCSPLPPQAICGEISQGIGLMVHRSDCPAISKLKNKDQLVALAWEESALTQSFSAALRIKARNERGALARMAALVAVLGADVNNIRVSGNSVEENRASIDLDIQVRSKFHLDRVVEALAKDPAVIGVA
jgi:RelA/SpoT family (p)ppGpp synthetase